MWLADYVPDICGGYVLAPPAQLGYFDTDRRWQPETVLSQALAPLIAEVLANLERDGDTARQRVALIHPDHSDKPWQSATLVFEDDTLRRLYPVAAAPAGPLTTFQLRNRDKSIFRGLERLLDFRDPATPELPVYGPLLVYRGTTLAHYSPHMDRVVRPGEFSQPVIEVIDLLAGVPRHWRMHPAIGQYLSVLRRTLVHPERRMAPNLVDFDTARPVSRPALAAIANPYIGPAQAEVDQLHARFAPTAFRDWDYGYWVDALCTPVMRARIGQILRAGARRYLANPESLRCFERFATLERRALGLIAARNPVLTVPPGMPLLDRGSRDDWNLYLLKGELVLNDEHDAKERLVARSPAASRPVGLIKPRARSVVARTKAVVLWLHEPMIEAVVQMSSKRATDVRDKPQAGAA